MYICVNSVKGKHGIAKILYFCASNLSVHECHEKENYKIKCGIVTMLTSRGGFNDKL